MILSVTPLYAALIAILFLVLTARVIMRRGAARISLGDGADSQMLKRMRAQANLVETAPLALILMLLLELNGSGALLLHIFGLMLLLGRILHTYALSASPQVMIFRQVGMVLTLSMIGISALWLLVQALL